MPVDNPFAQESLAQLADAIASWKTQYSSTESVADFIALSSQVIESITEFSTKSDSKQRHNWRTRLALNSLLSDFANTLNSLAGADDSEAEQLQKIQHSLAEFLESPLTRALKNFNQNRGANETVESLLSRSNGVIQTLKQYAEIGYYPTYEQWQQWKKNPGYDSSRDEGWYFEELENRSEDQYAANNIISDVSALRAKGGLSDSEIGQLEEFTGTLMANKDGI